MDNYLFHLLQLLVENGPMTIQDISYFCDISIKTAEKRIKELNNILNNTAYISKGILKYQLKINNYSAFLNLETQFLKGELDLNDPTKREAFIIQKLVKNTKYIPVDVLADQMIVSRKVVNNDLQHLKRLLEDYDAKIESRTGKGIKLSVKQDYDILFILRNFVVTRLTKNKWRKITEEFENKVTNIPIKQQTKKQIRNNLISIWLAKEADYSVKEFPKYYIPVWNENSVTSELKNIGKNIVGNLTPAEEIFLLSPISLYKNECFDQEKLDMILNKNYQIISSYLSDDLQHYNLIPQNVYSRIKWHMFFLVNRAMLHEKISEVLPKNIADKYPISLELSRNLSQAITQNYKIKVSIDEINYFVIYFQMLLDEKTENNPDYIDIAFIGEVRESVKEFIKSKLGQIYNDINTDSYYSISDFKESKNHYLLGFSAQPFTSNQAQIVNIGTAVRSESLSLIMQVSQAETFINQGKCKITVSDLQAKTYHEAVEKLIDEQIGKGELNKDFKERWIQREKYTNNIFPNGIAIPHAADSSGKNRILISIGKIKNNLSYKNRSVRLIFLLAIPESLDNELINVTSRIYDLIGIISRNTVLHGNLLNYDSSKSFMQITEGV